MSGLTKPLEHWGLVIGNQWNGSVEGIVRDVTLSAEIDGIAGRPPMVGGDGDSADGGAARAAAARPVAPPLAPRAQIRSPSPRPEP